MRVVQFEMVGLLVGLLKVRDVRRIVLREFARWLNRRVLSSLRPRLKNPLVSRSSPGSR